MKQATAPVPPPFRVHKPTQQAYILYQGNRVYLGRADKPEAQLAYARLTAEMAANGGMLRPKAHEATVDEICAQYWSAAQIHYRSVVDGTPTGSLTELRLSLKPLVRLYGDSPAKALGPSAIKTVRESWIKDGLSRTSVNKRVGYLKRMVRWAAENELIPATTWHAVQCVSNLKRGRTAAPEPRRVKPVPLAHVSLAKAHLPSAVCAMIDLQLSTGARPGEVTGLRAIDIDTTGHVWIARVERHKTAYTGAERKIYIGPKGQSILRPFMVRRPIDKPLFSPQEAEAERLAMRHAQATTPRRPGQKPNPRKTDRQVGEAYDSHSYRHAITRAIEKVNKNRPESMKIPNWAPNQLRHNFATMIRQNYGLDGAQVLLGHSDADITQVYAEKDEAQALRIIEKVG